MLLWSLLACQAPFGADRHDLLGFRVAAVRVTSAAPGDELVPHVALIVDDHPWSPDNVDLRWFWLDDPDALLALDPLSEPIASGPRPALTLPDDTRLLGLIALRGGEDRRALIEVPAPPRALPRLVDVTLETLPLDLDDLEGPELVLEARAGLDGSPTDHVPEDGVGRLTAAWADDPGDDVVVRWMSTAGTWLELEPSVADWVPADLFLDEDELDGDVTPLGTGPVTVLALGVGEVGETWWHATEVHVGAPPAGVWTGGRWLQVDPALPDDLGGSWVRGTLRADDDAPTGFRLEAAELVDPSTDPGTPQLSCQLPLDGPFDPAWLLEGVCPRDPLDGAVVVIEPEAR